MVKLNKKQEKIMKKYFLPLIFIFILLMENISLAVVLNQTCLDDYTLQVLPDIYNETCQFGCDNTTNSCNPPQYQVDLITFGIVISFIIGLIILFKYYG